MKISEKRKKGATKYTIPTFTSNPASEEMKRLLKLDVELQEYLKEYLDRTQNAAEYVNDEGAQSFAQPSDQLAVLNILCSCIIGLKTGPVQKWMGLF